MARLLSVNVRVTASRVDGRNLADDAEHERAAAAGCHAWPIHRLANGAPPIYRSYSLSGPLSTARYRISVKIEPNGMAGIYLREHLRLHDSIDVSSPRGSFLLQHGERPVVLLSAGIGATPVLAMLSALSAEHSKRRVLWLHSARNGQYHPFAAEARRLVLTLDHGHSFICYSRPDSHDRSGEDFDGLVSGPIAYGPLPLDKPAERECPRLLLAAQRRCRR